MGSTGDVCRGEGRLYLLFCCRAGDKTGELGLGEHRKRRGSAGSQPASLPDVSSFFLRTVNISVCHGMVLT